MERDEERDEWFYDYAKQDAQELLEEARANAGEEVRGVIGRQVSAGVAVEVVETAEETFVIFKWEDIPDETIFMTLLNAFYSGVSYRDWDDSRLFPLRVLEPGETAWCYLKT